MYHENYTNERTFDEGNAYLIDLQVKVKSLHIGPCEKVKERVVSTHPNHKTVTTYSRYGNTKNGHIETHFIFTIDDIELPSDFEDQLKRLIYINNDYKVTMYGFKDIQAKPEGDLLLIFASIKEYILEVL